MSDGAYLGDFLDSDDDSYMITEEDRVIVSSALELIFKIIGSDLANQEEREVIACVGCLLAKLPDESDSMDAVLTLTGPRRHYGEHAIYHWWEIRVEEENISISSAGHFYRASTGGDSFTSMEWSAYPGEPAEYRDYLSDLWMVDDATSFPNEISQIDLREASYSLKVYNDGEPIEKDELADDEIDDEDGNGEIVTMPTTPADDANVVLESYADYSRGQSVGNTHVNPPDTCDQCHCDLAQQKFFVDGRICDSLVWSNMCSECFVRLGGSIAWGSGQLYSRQADDSWLLVGGFQPSESE